MEVAIYKKNFEAFKYICYHWTDVECIEEKLNRHMDFIKENHLIKFEIFIKDFLHTVNEAR